jgi:hypothetical protein
LEFIFPWPLLPGVWYRIALRYDPARRALDTFIASNSVPVLTNTVPLGVTSAGFRLDAVAITSYNSTGGSSILAHGRVDNVVFSVPEPPRLFITVMSNGPQLSFNLATNWTASIERSADFESWTNLFQTNGSGLGALREWTDADANTNAFYRLNLSRP